MLESRKCFPDFKMLITRHVNKSLQFQDDKSYNRDTCRAVLSHSVVSYSLLPHGL